MFAKSILIKAYTTKYYKDLQTNNTILQLSRIVLVRNSDGICLFIRKKKETGMAIPYRSDNCHSNTIKALQ